MPQLVVIGLGNPGKQYESTRHNIGFLALDHLRAELRAGEWQDRQKFLAVISEASIGNRTILLAKPMTYMNRSGECVRKLVDFYKLDPATQLLVISDDIDLPLGTHRFRESGGPGTHNGLKSIVECIGEGFPRLRIGFGPKPDQIDLAAWVLSVMGAEEVKALEGGFVALEKKVREIS